MISGNLQSVQGINFKIKTKIEKELCFKLSPVRLDVWNPLPISVETESINGFRNYFYKCIEVSSSGGPEISRFGNPPDY